MIKQIRQICEWWKARAVERRLARTMPAVVERKQKIAALRMRHKSTKLVIAEQRQDIHAALGMRGMK